MSNQAVRELEALRPVVEMLVTLICEDLSRTEYPNWHKDHEQMKALYREYREKQAETMGGGGL